MPSVITDTQLVEHVLKLGGQYGKQAFLHHIINTVLEESAFQSKSRIYVFAIENSGATRSHVW